MSRIDESAHPSSWTAESRREWMISIITIFGLFSGEGWRRFRHAEMRSPTGPAPRTRMAWGDFIEARVGRREVAWRATLRGSRREAKWGLNPGGSLWHQEARWFSPPWRVPSRRPPPRGSFPELRKRRLGQMLYWPKPPFEGGRQRTHSPHGTPTSRATRSPTSKTVEWRASESSVGGLGRGGQIAVTTPQDSWPRMRGDLGTIDPFRKCR